MFPMTGQRWIELFRQPKSYCFAFIVATTILVINSCSNNINVGTEITKTKIQNQGVGNDNIPTSAIILTNTPIQSSLKTPTLTPNPALSNTSRSTPQPSPTGDYYDQIKYSPDNKWVAKLYSEYAYPTHIQTIEITDNNGVVIWTIPFQGETPTGDPRPNLKIIKWSDDSNYLYYYYSFNYDGGPTLWTGKDLQKIDVATGTTRWVLPGMGLMAFSFSPSKEWIAYARSQDEPRRLIIRHLERDTEKSTTIDREVSGYIQVGWITWSNRGTGIVFYTFIDWHMQVIYLNVDTMKQTILIEFEYGNYWFDGWESENKIRYLHDQTNDIIEINVHTGERVAVGTVTPTPEN